MSYLKIGLIILLLAMGAYVLALRDSVATTGSQVELLAQDINAQTEQTIKVEKSAAVTQVVTAESHQIEKAIDTSMQDQLRTLNKTPTTVPKEKPNEVNQDRQATAAAVVLSPQLVKLLDDSYCEGNTDDTYCTSRGASDRVLPEQSRK